MASIGSTLPSSTTPSTTATAAAAAVSSSNSLASQQTFLQLLVAQLQNQDPTQPVEGTAFVTQLATFSDVEQNLGVRQDVDAISNKDLGYVPSGGTVVAAPSTTTTPATGTTPTGTVSGG